MSYARFNVLTELRKIKAGKPTKIDADTLLHIIATEYQVVPRVKREKPSKKSLHESVV